MPGSACEGDDQRDKGFLLKCWRERFYPECHCPEEQQQQMPQGEQTSEQNDPLTPPRRTDPPAGMPEMQPLAQAQAGTKASKEELEQISTI